MLSVHSALQCAIPTTALVPVRASVSLQAYARKLGDCLIEITRAGSGINSEALTQLRTWTSECSSLRVFMVLGSPKKFEAYIAKRLDGKPGLDASELDDSWYDSMLVRPRWVLLLIFNGSPDLQPIPVLLSACDPCKAH